VVKDGTPLLWGIQLITKNNWTSFFLILGSHVCFALINCCLEGGGDNHRTKLTSLVGKWTNQTMVIKHWMVVCLLVVFDHSFSRNLLLEIPCLFSSALRWLFLLLKTMPSWAPVAHAYNSSYSGGKNQEDHGLEPAWANSSSDLILKNPSQKRADGVAQSVGPEFKPQYWKRKKSCNFLHYCFENVVLFFSLKAGSYCVAQAGFKLMICLPQPPKRWDGL
jgi:hypothetical protein